uniref:RPA_interact_C domain-containing protein n=1 Tax=Anopheles christyi TaxID=43041 RepID=A0A182K780_9DIPT
MELINPGPSSHQTSVADKIRSKDAARRFKYGSPKLVDLMREKCRIRIKEARNDQFLKKRNILQEEKSFLASIVREELSELEQDIALQELIYKELMEDAEQWLFYEQAENYLIDTYDTDAVFCPICEHSVLQLDSVENLLNCSCGVRLRYDGSMKDFTKLVTETIAQHAVRCASNLQFFTEPIVDVDFVQLNAFCLGCDYYRELTTGGGGGSTTGTEERKRCGETIHSGQFMVSHFETEGAEDDDDDLGMQMEEVKPADLISADTAGVIRPVSASGGLSDVASVTSGAGALVPLANICSAEPQNQLARYVPRHAGNRSTVSQVEIDTDLSTVFNTLNVTYT